MKRVFDVLVDVRIVETVLSVVVSVCEVDQVTVWPS